jgi:uncharacterized protein YndB with AHSA1/START domain
MSAYRRARPAGRDHDLSIERIIDAPRPVVYEAWTDYDCMAQWPAPRGYLITHSEADPRPGGTWRSCMRSPAGEDLWLGGTYREVVPNERLVFTHAWEGPEGEPGHETLVSVELEDHEGGTRLSFCQSGFQTIAERDGHAHGWNEAFDRLDELLSRTLHRRATAGRRPRSSRI